MNDMIIKITELFKSKGLQDASKFATAIVNAIIAACNAGLIKLDEVPIQCEKCGRDASEWVLTVTGIFKWIFSFKLTAVIHIMWDEKCGRSYFRVKFIK